MTAVLSSLLRALSNLSQGAVLRVALKSVAATLAVFVALGWALSLLLPRVISRWLSLSDDTYVVLSTLLVIVLGWLLFRVVALAVLQFFVDDVVVAVERRDYPQAAHSARALPFREDLGNSLRGAARAIGANLVAAPFAIALLFTAIGPAVLLWAVNGWLLGRELHDMAWLRHRHAPEEKSPVSAGQRFLLGGAIAALLIVPFVNLAAPVLGAAAATHLVQRTHRKSGKPVS